MQLLWFMLRFREKRERGQEQKDEEVSSYLLVHLKPVSFYRKDGQAPAQVAQRGGGCPSCRTSRLGWMQQWATRSNPACFELSKELNEATSGGPCQLKYLFRCNHRIIYNSNSFFGNTTSAFRLTVFLP